MPGYSDWSYNAPQGQPGTIGSSPNVPVVPWRNQLDARRTGNAAPYAEYPDGYLGTVRSRREDRLLNAVKQSLNKRSYQRGVHVGERVPSEDYSWPEDFNPQTSLRLQAQGKRFAPKGIPAERLVNDGKNIDMSPEELTDLAVKYGVRSSEPLNIAAGQARKLLPSWR
ncbi:hypothetical protein FDA94_28985 [Herbidospora galbida]|uniref:Uncharacterized protein n=1 Tax=Herbidospora galbida TaxID=2575442 RepID=A0A4V6XBB7_9ACTN|nr:hypothetical protein [Herbidospora galbida]TKK84653.1 hypothetical protein FDA94_28985 [Herbidospora galbida]